MTSYISCVKALSLRQKLSQSKASQPFHTALKETATLLSKSQYNLLFNVATSNRFGYNVKEFPYKSAEQYVFTV